MANNVTLPLTGTGDATAKAVTDDCGVEGHAQIIKLGIATAASRVLIPADATDGLLVNLGANNDVTVTGVATAANQATEITSLQLLDDAVYASDGALNKTLGIGAVFDDVAPVAITENQGGYLRMSSRRALLVEGVASGTAVNTSAAQSGTWNITNVSGTVSLPTGASTAALQTQPGVDIGDVTINNAAGAAAVNIQDGGNSITIDGSVSVTGTVTVDSELPAAAAITDNFANPTTSNLMAMGMVWDGAAWDRAAGTSADGALVNLGTNNDVTVTNATSANLKNEPAGNVAHAAADSGNPIKIGAKVETSLESVTLAADGNRSDLYADADGVQMVKLYCPLGDVTQERVTNTDGASTAFTNFGAVASVRNYITTIVIFNSSATDGFVDFRDGTAGSVIFTAPAPKGGGSVISLPVPLRQPTVNTALAFDVSAALSTVYISVIGFQGKV